MEDWDRFDEVKRLFKKKYRDRFRSLTPTDAAKKNLLGDNRLAPLKCPCAGRHQVRDGEPEANDQAPLR